MTLSIWCGWDDHEVCDGRFCKCKCHESGRREWEAWQGHVEDCLMCRRVVQGLRIGRCDEGNKLVTAFLDEIHKKVRR